MAQEPVKVVIEVSGGCLSVVYAGVPLDVVLIDHDDIERGGQPPEEFRDGTKVQDFLEAPLTVPQW